MKKRTNVNSVRVSNLKDFLNEYTRSREDYRGAFDIIAELESKVIENDNPPEHISVEYRLDGFIIFGLSQINLGEYGRSMVYYYCGSAS